MRTIGYNRKKYSQKIKIQITKKYNTVKRVNAFIQVQKKFFLQNVESLDSFIATS